MAINRLQFGGLLNPKESFGWEEYGQPGPKITTPSLLGAGVLGDVTGKKLRTQRGLKCPTGTQPNASNTACIPIKKTTTTTPITTTTTETGLTCAQRGLVDDGMGGCKRPDGTEDGPITTTTQDGCPQGWSRDQWGNCHPTPLTTSEEAKNLFDQRWEGKGPANIFTVAPPRVDPRTGQTISDTGISMADAAKNYGLTPEESYRVTYSPYGAEERGQGAARGTWDTPQQGLIFLDDDTSMMGDVDYGAALAQQPAPLSTQDFLAQYSRPSKTVDQGILGPDQEGAEARRIAEMQAEVYGVDNLFMPSPRARVTAGPTAAEIRNEESARQGREQSQRTEEARDRLDDIKEIQATEKASKAAQRKADKAQAEVRQAKATDKAQKQAKAQKAVNEAHTAMMAATMATAQARRNTANLKSKGTFAGMQVGLLGAR